MTEEAWESLVESVLSKVEPDADARDRLRGRLREDIGTLHSVWSQGGDSKWIGRILRRLALEVL